MSRSKAEMERFGFTSQDVGRELLVTWHFPAEICDALIQYRKPLSEEASALAKVLHLSLYLNARVWEDSSKEEIVSEFPMKVVMACEVSTKVINEIEEIIAKGKELEMLAA